VKDQDDKLCTYVVKFKSEKDKVCTSEHGLVFA
jgi:hypothetical protein